eukprot:6483752-Pyramimonas_sp.AAC.1
MIGIIGSDYSDHTHGLVLHCGCMIGTIDYDYSDQSMIGIIGSDYSNHPMIGIIGSGCSDHWMIGIIGS